MIEVRLIPDSQVEVPFTHVDALIVLGIGSNVSLKGPHKTPRIEDKRMRLNALAAKELAASGHLSTETIIIPTGKGTEIVQTHITKLHRKQTLLNQAAGRGELRGFLPRKLTYLDYQDLAGQPATEEELTDAAKASQGELMADLIKQAVAKSNKTQHVQIKQDIVPEATARTTILNLIEALNILDEHAGGVWQGNIAILTSNAGHLQRAEESAKALGLTHTLMLSSEQVLLSKGYNNAYLNQMLEMTESDAREQQKNLRAISEIPEFLVPEVVFIKRDDRLKQVVAYLESYYGRETLEKYGIANHQQLSAGQIRERIGNIGIARIRMILEASTPDDLQELGIAGLDPSTQLEELRTRLSKGVAQAEKVRRLLMKKYGDDSGWQIDNGLPDLASTEWYRIKNWIYGRMLPPNDFGDSADVYTWLRKNKMYNEMTETWLDQTSAKF